MTRRHGRGSTLRSVGMQVANASIETGSKAIVSTFKWAATDHSGMSRALAHMPDMGILDSLKHIFMHFLIAVVGAILGGIWLFLLIAYGIPFLITGEF